MESKKILLNGIYKHIQSDSIFLTNKHVYICERLKSCCFTGNRPEKLPDMGNEKSAVIIEIKKMLMELIEMAVIIGYKHFISGLDRGIDIWAAEIILELKEKGYDIELHCVIPHLGQTTDRWDIEYLKRYYRLLQKCTRSYLVSMRYTNKCIYEHILTP